MDILRPVPNVHHGLTTEHPQHIDPHFHGNYAHQPHLPPQPLLHFQEIPKPEKIVQKLREILDGDLLNTNDEHESPHKELHTPAAVQFRTYPSSPEQYQQPQYQPQYQPSYEPQYLPQYQPQYQPPYQQQQSYVPNYEPPKYQSTYESKYAPKPPKYAQSPYPKPTCGSSLLFSCTPQVQTVPCYSAPPYHPQSSPYQQPPSYRPPVSHSASYQPPAPPKYVDYLTDIPRDDVYSQPGPPYPDPNLQSTQSSSIPHEQSRNASKASNHVPTPPSSVQRKDSEPEPSNIAKKMGQSETTESVGDLTTTMQFKAVTPSTVEQMRKLNEKIENHVESLEKFTEVARKKLRQAIDRSNDETLTSELEDIQHFLNISPQMIKRGSVKNMYRNRDSINSVW